MPCARSLILTQISYQLLRQIQYNEYDIVREYNNYFLDYQEQYDPQNRWTDRIISSSGDWSGNVYDFYFRVYNKLQQDIKTPFKLEGITRVDDTPVHQALREALANCLVNADYYGRRGVVIIKKPELITLSNPGNLRIELTTALSGGVSDPRNSAMLKMFNFIDIGERAGSGIPNIFRVWREQKWNAPFLSESFEPDRITLSLPISPITIGNKKATTKSDDKKVTIKSDDKKVTAKTEKQLNAIIYYLTENPEGTVANFEIILGVKSTRVKQLLYILIEKNIIEADGTNKKRIYRLKR